MEPGRQLSQYRLGNKLGEGGMGVVWKATDTTLDRAVAIKVLTEALAADPERLLRFEREARSLAALNHANVAAVYGLHEDAGIRFLAMEFVAGEDLAARLARGPLPVERALEIGREIAEGLAAAHAAGIVHRDLKPANVMLTAEGRVKLLDFGLAKALAPDAAPDASDASLSPTLTSAGTVAGMILGTAGYMSPEQAKGRAVDRRADIWSFGALLFEMLSGRRVFDGDGIPEILAAVLKSDPDWDVLPADTPRVVRSLLRRCLVKQPHDRLHDIGDARIMLDEALAGGADALGLPEPRTIRPASRWPLLAGIAVAGLALIHAWLAGPQQTAAAPVRLQIAGDTLDFSATALPFALAPDGQSLVYVDLDGPTKRLFLRRMDSFEVRPLAGTEGGAAPFFSPDGAWIGFFAHNQLNKVAVAGGRPIPLCATPHAAGGAAWLPDDTIVFSMAYTPTGLLRVDAGGGEPTALTAPDRAAGEFNHRDPHGLPDGRSLLFTVDAVPERRIGLLSLDDGSVRMVDGAHGRARFLPGGHLLYGDDDALLVAPFDPDAAERKGPPVAVLRGVGGHQDGLSFAVAATGALAYLPPAEFRYVWLDRQGSVTSAGIDEPHGGRPILSNDNRRLAVTGGTAARASEFHVYDLERGSRIRLEGSHAQWFPDDSELVVLLRPGASTDMYRRRSDGSGEPRLVHASPSNSIINDISRDGQWLLFYEQDLETSRDIWVTRADGSGGARPLVVRPGSDRAAAFSPDGRWFAYASDASGRDEVYVRRFDPNGGETAEHLVSTAGGREPRWSEAGGELFYRAGRALMAVPVELGNGFRAGEPRALFEGRWGVETGGMNPMYDVAADGRRFLMVETSAAANTIHVVLNWRPELERRLAAGTD